MSILHEGLLSNASGPLAVRGEVGGTTVPRQDFGLGRRVSGHLIYEIVELIHSGFAVEFRMHKGATDGAGMILTERWGPNFADLITGPQTLAVPWSNSCLFFSAPGGVAQFAQWEVFGFGAWSVDLKVTLVGTELPAVLKPPSPELLRFQRSARRRLRRSGGVCSFQQYVLTKDWEAGAEAATATGPPILAAADKVEEVVRKGGKVVSTMSVLHVEILAFAAENHALGNALIALARIRDEEVFASFRWSKAIDGVFAAAPDAAVAERRLLLQTPLLDPVARLDLIECHKTLRARDHPKARARDDGCRLAALRRSGSGRE